MKSRMRATAPLRTGSSTRSVNHFLKDDGSKGNATWHKCWMCRNSAHWPDQCQKFAALSVDERLKMAKENHVCFGCLKRAGREHRMENCTRRQRCTKQENGKQCEHYHHPLLHKSNAIRLGVAAVAAGKGALLPVMSAIIHGQNGIRKKRKHPPRYWRSSKSYPVRHCGVTWTQRKGHLCNHSKSWWRRGNHKNKGIPSTCQFWR